MNHVLFCCYVAGDVGESGGCLVHLAIKQRPWAFVFAGLFHSSIIAIGLHRFSKTSRKSSFDILYLINSTKKERGRVGN